ncbi:unnamed protein product [Periconia digitata]|uniref:ubiquitinyl hydrolase 1 n=1 Tax=Periconia digitata TaxID=1303443 RepID=A0A9W4UMH9_9PLEO|nr:unnamed protein product [Periconia digitata]
MADLPAATPIAGSTDATPPVKEVASSPGETPTALSGDAPASTPLLSTETDEKEVAKTPTSTDDNQVEESIEFNPLSSKLPETETPKLSSPVSTDEPRVDQSAASMKRPLSPSPAEEEHLSKKIKTPPSIPPHEEEDDDTSERFPSPPEQSATKLDKETWQGFCELECEPAYFSAILHRIGVQGVTVREMPVMDPDYLPRPIFGLVVLFRHREFDQERQSKTCPPDVWFANQMPAQNSCATLAMIHALLNLSPTAQENMDLDIDIGEHMRQFKDFTKDFTPYQRGEAFASWDYVKKIHNSFAKKMDMLENDRLISLKSKRAAKYGMQKPKSAEKTTKPATSSTRGRDAESPKSDDSFEDNSHHYIVFVPINGTVWKLDGMDSQPTAMSTYPTSSPKSWISSISDRVAALIAGGGDDYGLFALAQCPLPPLRREICVADNTIKKLDTRLTALTPTWRDFVAEGDCDPPSPSFLSGFTPEQRQLERNAVPVALAAEIDEESDVSELIKRRTNIVAEMRRLFQEYTAEEWVVNSDMQKAEARTHDLGPAIRAWVEMLAENGYLEENCKRFPRV